VSVCIVQKVYRKNLNILCNQNLKLFRQIHRSETLLDRRDYLGRLLHKICLVMEIYATFKSNFISTFRDK